jgi:2-keto-4-pentenoate hydratase/2-oxohepta-3-ene-1,7-dioic acid hydratase in catechol pathway
MKLITFQNSGSRNGYRIGALDGENIIDLTSIRSERDISAAEILQWLDLESGFLDKGRDLVRSKDSSLTVDRNDIHIMPPVPRPGKIICIGLNYRDHAAESGMPIPASPIIFSKFSSCTIGPDDAVIIPAGSSQLDYEAELAFVIGRKARNVRAADALGHVFGYTNFNDISARDFQFADGQWQRGKSCETFAPMGEFIATANEIKDPQNLSIKLLLNGEVMQNSNTDQMIFGVADLIEFLSRHITLEPGDVVATGTPPGVGFARKPPVYLKDGDIVEVEIDGLGTLRNPIASP